MTNEEIRDTLKDILRNSGIEDLEPEDFLPDTIPDEENRIGFFFILGDELYMGENFFGSPDYVCIGKTDQLKHILYRTIEGEQTITFVFDFGSYRVFRYHEAYEESKIAIYDYSTGECRVDDATIDKSASVIEQTIRSIVQSASSQVSPVKTADSEEPGNLSELIDSLLTGPDDDAWMDKLDAYLSSMPHSRQSVEQMLEAIQDYDCYEVYTALLTEYRDLLTEQELQEVQKKYDCTFDDPSGEEDE